jgi:flagellar basal body-associated protein FliL
MEKKVKKLNENERNKISGITLIALVVTIIVLLILAGIVIYLLLGDNGIITQAQSAKDSSRAGEVQEVINLAVSENQVVDYKGSTVKTKDDIIQELYADGKLTDAEVATLQTSDTVVIGSITVDFSELSKEIAKTPEDNEIAKTPEDKESSGGGDTENRTYISKSTVKADSYVGYYADIDDDGTVDGIIYADLAVGKIGSGQWGNSWGNYEIPIIATNELKDYVISTHTYTGQTTAGIYKANEKFGTKEVIVPVKSSSGTKDRFYVMSLENFTTEIDDESCDTFYWYEDAYGSLDNTIDYSEDDFGMGKENTSTMIDIWNGEEYGVQGDYDMWGVIQETLEKDKKEKNIVWFVPSKSEWSAFGEELGIKKNYTNFGLNSWYWSSSQYNDYNAYLAYFYNGCIDGRIVCSGINYVRLSATF